MNSWMDNMPYKENDLLYIKMKDPIDAYPFGCEYVPVEIIKEYPTYYLAEVMPHYHKEISRGEVKDYNFGISRTYKITLDKVDFINGSILIDEDHNEREEKSDFIDNLLDGLLTA